MNPRNLLLMMILVVVALGGLYWSQQPKPQPVKETVTPAPAAKVENRVPLPQTVVQQELPAAAPAAVPEAEPPVYETRIDEVLRSNVGETQTAKILINMLPTMPEEGQVEAAQHIANLLPDSDYRSVVPILTNPQTPESVTSVLFTDLMNRSDATKLNGFLEIAQVPNHPNQEEAVSDLQIFLDHDYGTNWAQWKRAIAEYLAKQAVQQ